MKTVQETFTIQERDIESLAHKVLDIASVYDASQAVIIFLQGDLGAGKTTFTKALAEALGVKDTVLSPTFILKKVYQSHDVRFKTLVHVDAYRFDTQEEAKVLKLEHDIEEPHSLLVIEWPDKLPTLRSDVAITLEVVDDVTREVTLEYEK